MNAVVVGGAEGALDAMFTLSTSVPAGTIDTVIAVNAIGCCIEPLDHWASLHPECFWRNNGDPEQGWLHQRLRRFERSSGAARLWGPADKAKYCDQSLETQGRGSSGYFGVEVAQHLGAEKIILCGIPMTETPHFDSEEPWEMANAHWKHWTRAHRAGRLRNVRSMSGRTRDLLGAPTREWLAGTSAGNTEPEVAGAPYPS